MLRIAHEFRLRATFTTRTVQSVSTRELELIDCRRAIVGRMATRPHSVRLERFLTARRLRKTSVDDSAAAIAAAAVDHTSDATVMRAILMRVSRDGLIELQAALQTELEEKWLNTGGVTDSKRFEFAEQAIVLLRNVLDSRDVLGETKVAPRARALTESEAQNASDTARRTRSRRQATLGTEIMTLRTALAAKTAQNAVLEARLASLMRALDGDDLKATSDYGDESDGESAVFPSSPPKTPSGTPPAPVSASAPRSSARGSLALAASNAAAAAAQVEAAQLRVENTQLLEQLRALGCGLAGSPRTRLQSNIVALVAQLRNGDAAARDAAAAAGALLHSAAAALRGSGQGAPPVADPTHAPTAMLEARNAELRARVRELEAGRVRTYAARCALEEQLAVAQRAATQSSEEAAAGAASAIALRSELLNAHAKVWAAEVEAIAGDMLHCIEATGSATATAPPFGATASPRRRFDAPSCVHSARALRSAPPPSIAPAFATAAPVPAEARRGAVPRPPSVVVQLVEREKHARRVFADESERARRRSMEAAAKAADAAAEAESFSGAPVKLASRAERTTLGARSRGSSTTPRRVARATAAAASRRAPRDPFIDRFVLRSGGGGAESPIAANVYF